MIDLPANEICPKCHKPILTAHIELHPTKRDTALYEFTCEDCGPVITRNIDLRSRVLPKKD